MKLADILKVGCIAIWLAGPIVGFFGTEYLVNHNESWNRGEIKVVKKRDGILSSTRLDYLPQKYASISRNSLFNGVSIYFDDGLDCAVDTVHENMSSLSRSFNRSEDYNSHPKVFDNADRIFRTQMKRFVPGYCDKKSKCQKY